MNGAVEPGGGVAVRATSAAAHEATLARMLTAIQLPDDVRIWALVSIEGPEAHLTVRAGAADVMGEATIDLPPALATALRAIVGEVAEDARRDLKLGLARTLAAPATGRSG